MCVYRKALKQDHTDISGWQYEHWAPLEMTSTVYMLVFLFLNDLTYFGTAEEWTSDGKLVRTKESER